MELLQLLDIKYANDLLASDEDKRRAKDYIRHHLDSSLTIQSKCLKRCSYFSYRLEDRVIRQRDERIFRQLLDDVMIEKGLTISMITGKMAPIYILKNA